MPTCKAIKLLYGQWFQWPRHSGHPHSLPVYFVRKDCCQITLTIRYGHRMVILVEVYIGQDSLDHFIVFLFENDFYFSCFSGKRGGTRFLGLLCTSNWNRYPSTWGHLHYNIIGLKQLNPLLMTPSGNLHMYDRQTGGTHPTVMYSCLWLRKDFLIWHHSKMFVRIFSSPWKRPKLLKFLQGGTLVWIIGVISWNKLCQNLMEIELYHNIPKETFPINAKNEQCWQILTNSHFHKKNVSQHFYSCFLKICVNGHF